mmetsp:Transcript_21452/g.62750  ORF Transcript_21452/g.62750 Transcript_21452/m.62750 type:complete len:224 (+) Transcript_21452:3567-4238(+)
MVVAVAMQLPCGAAVPLSKGRQGGATCACARMEVPLHLCAECAPSGVTGATPLARGVTATGGARRRALPVPFEEKAQLGQFGEGCVHLVVDGAGVHIQTEGVEREGIAKATAFAVAVAVAGNGGGSGGVAGKTDCVLAPWGDGAHRRAALGSTLVLVVFTGVVVQRLRRGRDCTVIRPLLSRHPSSTSSHCYSATARRSIPALWRRGQGVAHAARVTAKRGIV